MKKLKFTFLCISMLAYSITNAQLEITGGAGIANYYGDLAQPHVFKQSSYAISGGINYQFSPKFSWRSELTFGKIGASDSKNKRADLKARNLSFKSSIFSLNTAIEYDFVNMAEHRFSPFVFLGIGIFHFNPYTKDRNGNKQFLQPLGTEGQGLAAYPNRKPYKRTQLEIPMGLGVKYAINDKIVIGLELKYNYVDTDYLDDVSESSYADQAILAAKNPLIPKLTYRGDELAGGQPYPGTKSGLSRGNPKHKDLFYTTLVKIAFRLKSNQVQINY